MADYDSESVDNDQPNNVADDTDDTPATQAHNPRKSLKFQCKVVNIDLSYRNVEVIDIFLRFHFGATKTQYGRGSSTKLGGTSVKSATEPVSQGKSVSFPKPLTTKWSGTIEKLDTNYFVCQAVIHRKHSKDIVLGETWMRLKNLANGCIYQEIEIKGSSQADVVCQVNFQCYFQEVAHLELLFENWTGNSLRAMDKGVSSDPFVICRLDKNTNTGGKKIISSCKSRIEYQNLSPVWDGPFLGNIVFQGTLSELELEFLEVVVMDWDSLKNDLIGKARVPLRGVFGQNDGRGKISVNLGYDEDSRRGDKVLLFGGKVEGEVRLLNSSVFKQFGEVFVKEDNRRHLIVELEEIKQLDLPPTVATVDVNPFLGVEWGGVIQKSKIYYGQTTPKITQAFYFPIDAVKITKNEIQEKGNVFINCYHFHDGHESVFIGTNAIELWKITSSQLDATKKTRLFQDRLKLIGPSAACHIDLSVYFSPDLPDGMHFEKSGQKDFTELKEIYRVRELKWRSGIELTKSLINSNYMVKAMDENLKLHFLPEYLTPVDMPSVKVPREDQWRRDNKFNFNTPHAIARMVRCIPWTRTKQEGYVEDNVWLAPNLFMDLRRGSLEDHVVMLCNVFLGKGMDAYVCIGKSRLGIPHTWVLERMPQGHVRLWETTTNSSYVLRHRHLTRNNSRGGRSNSRKSSRLSQASSQPDFSDDDTGSQYSVSEDESASTSSKNSQEKDAKKLFAGASKLSKREQKNITSELVAEKKKRMVEYDISRKLARMNYGMKPESADSVPLAKEQTIQSATYAMFIRGNYDEEQYEDVINTKEEDNWRNFVGCKFESSAGTDGAHRVPKLEQVLLPYRSVDVVFNNQNLWANLQHYNPGKIMYTFSDKRQWKPFVDREEGFDPYRGSAVRPFFDARILRDNLRDHKKLQKEAEEIREAVITEVHRYRGSRGLRRINFDDRLRSCLEELLKSRELNQSIDPNIYGRLFRIRRLKVGTEMSSIVGPGKQFRGTPFHFCRLPAKKIALTLLSQVQYHKQEKMDKFCLGVHLSAYPNAGLSIWVYFGHVFEKEVEQTV